MGLMQRLRSGTKYTVWLLVFSFGILWVLADTELFDAVMVGPQAMGEVDGQSIDWDEFNQRLNMYTEQYREQTGGSPDMEMRAQFESQAWDDIVADKVMQQKMDKLGLTVTDSELMDMIMGDDPDPFIRQQFTGPDGEFDREALQMAIQDPQNAPVWMMVEQQLREQRRQQKLNQLIESSIVVSESEIQREFKRQNSRVDFEYLRFPLSLVSADEIEVSESEMREFYDNNRNKFKRSKTWNFSYVAFSKDATPEDTLRLKEDFERLRDQFAAAENIEEFLRNHDTETGLYDDFLRPSEVRTEHLEAYRLNTGEVSDPYVFGDRVHMVKLLETRPSDQTYTRIREIELHFTDANRNEVEQQANELLQRIEDGENFRSLARQYSDNQSRAQQYGEAGFIARDGRDASIANPVFNAAVGEVVGPIEYDGAFYLIEVTDRSSEDIKFADLSRTVEADPMQTVEQQARAADDFSIFARDNGLEEEAEYEGYEIQSGVASDGNPVISGLGRSHVVLNELQYMSRREISDPIETDDYFYVIRVDDIQREGYRSFSEVEGQVRDLVVEKKRIERLKDIAGSARDAHGDLNAIAEAEGLTVEIAERVNLGDDEVPGAGREPAVVGAAFGTPVGELSSPIGGDNGVFLIQVQDRVEADLAELTDSEREQIREQLQQGRMMALGNIWAERLKADATVRDHRGLRR